MASKHRGEVVVPDRENIKSRLAGKLAVVVPLQKRAALGEVSNNLAARPQKQDATKKPPTDLIKKKQPAQKPNKQPIVSEESVLNLKQDDATKEISYSTRQLKILDPDEKSKNNPFSYSEYLSDMYKYLREMESLYPIKQDFLLDSKTTPKMRGILVNWLVEVHMNFQQCLETLHLCITIIDRYLQVDKKVGRDNLQLVGTAALLIATKYEEIYMPELSDFTYICDDSFTKQQLLSMERQLIRALDYNFGRPLAIHFLRRYSKVAFAELQQHNLAKYLLELILLDYDMAHVKPSIQAAAAACLSSAIWKDAINPREVWTPTLVHYTTYKYEDFKDVMVSVAQLLVKAKDNKKLTVFTKYESSSLGRISKNEKLYGRVVTRLVKTTTQSKK